MKQQWTRLATRFDALSLRERRLVAAAVVGGILLVGFTLFIDPGLARNRSLGQNIERQTAEALALEGQIAALEPQFRADPDAGAKRRIAELEASLQEAEQRLKTAESGLVPPERMPRVLEAVLARHPALRLVSLKTLKPAGVLGGDARDEAIKVPVSAFGLYRHGVEIRLEGSFADLLAYVADLERAQPGLLWGEARLDAEEHPRDVLSVVIYTLSSDKAWLAI